MTDPIEKAATDKAKGERAQLYRAMMQSWAWRDFEDEMLNAERKASLERAISASKIESVFEERGRVKLIDEIRNGLGYILDGIK